MNVYAIVVGSSDGPELASGATAADAVTEHYNSGCEPSEDIVLENFSVSAALLPHDVHETLIDKFGEVEPEELTSWLDEQLGVIWETADVTWDEDRLAVAKLRQKPA